MGDFFGTWLQYDATTVGYNMLTHTTITQGNVHMPHFFEANVILRQNFLFRVFKYFCRSNNHTSLSNVIFIMWFNMG